MSTHNNRKFKIMEVTPEVATRWLEKNTHNRQIRQNRVDQFAEAMKHGAWKLSTEAIAFSAPWIDAAGVRHDETLINGQHRLWAVIYSGKTVMFTVWWGCEADEFGVIDQGVPRTQGDVLGTTHPELLPNAKRIVSVITPVVGTIFAKHSKLVTWESELMLRNFPRELDAVLLCKQKIARICTAPVQAALFAAVMIDEARTGAMVERMHTAVGFSEKDPARALHLYLHGQRELSARDTKEVVTYKALHAMLCQIDEKPLVRLLPHIDPLGDARRRIKSKIDGVVKELHGGKLPEFFYYPRNTVHEKARRVTEP